MSTALTVKFSKEVNIMAKSDYFGLAYIVSVILAIIPITAWVCGWIT